MFMKKPLVEKSGIDQAIDNVLLEMQGFTADEDEYAKMVDQLTKLHALKVMDRTPDRINKDTLIIVLGNLLGIVMIIGYERTNVVTSKALNLLIRLR